MEPVLESPYWYVESNVTGAEREESLSCNDQFYMDINLLDHEDEQIEGIYSLRDGLQLDDLLRSVHEQTLTKTTITETLSDMCIPSRYCQSIADRILWDAKSLFAEAGRKALSMTVDVNVYDMDEESDSYVEVESDSDMEEEDMMGEAKFEPASKLSIEKLERVRIEEPSSMCAICVEEIVVDSEEIRTPCSHIYHGDCIVKWLEQSRFCPQCRYAMPAAAEDEAGRLRKSQDKF